VALVQAGAQGGAGFGELGGPEEFGARPAGIVLDLGTDDSSRQGYRSQNGDDRGQEQT
jgi:hypothetical protein